MVVLTPRVTTTWRWRGRVRWVWGRGVSRVRDSCLAYIEHWWSEWGKSTVHNSIDMATNIKGYQIGTFILGERV